MKTKPSSELQDQSNTSQDTGWIKKCNWAVVHSEYVVHISSLTESRLEAKISNETNGFGWWKGKDHSIDQESIRLMN